LPALATVAVNTINASVYIAIHTFIPVGTLVTPELVGACGEPMLGLSLCVVEPATENPDHGILLDGRSYKREKARIHDEWFLCLQGPWEMDAQGYLNFHSRMGEADGAWGQWCVCGS